MRYRKNADLGLQELSRRYLSDPGLGLQLYYRRRRAGKPIIRMDFEVLANFEIEGGEIPYEIDLELEFPYDVARSIWDQQPSIQAWYRLNKVRRDAWREIQRGWIMRRGIQNVDPDHANYYVLLGLCTENAREELEELRNNFVVNVSDSELAELWVSDIESRTYRQRLTIRKGVYTEYKRLIDGLIQRQLGEDPELIRLSYDIGDGGTARSLPNGALFSMSYGRNCCYDTEYYLGGTVSIQVFGYRGDLPNTRGVVQFSIIEYGRHYMSIIPHKLLHIKVPEDERILIDDYISPAYPLSRTPTPKECEEKGIPDNVVLSQVVNGAHLFEIIRSRYDKYIPEYKNKFESPGGRTRRKDDPNRRLINSKYYNPKYSHIWQISRLVSDRIKLLNLLDIPHKGGKIPGDFSGEFYFQQYKFILYPSRGKQGKRPGDKGRLMRLYVECPITGREIPTGRWSQYAPTLLKS